MLLSLVMLLLILHLLLLIILLVSLCRVFNFSIIRALVLERTALKNTTKNACIIGELFSHDEQMPKA